MRSVLLISLAFSVSTAAHAQALKGKVVGNDGKPVADVVISVPGHPVVRTDTNGEFSIKAIKGDKARLTFRHDN